MGMIPSECLIRAGRLSDPSNRRSCFTHAAGTPETGKSQSKGEACFSMKRYWPQRRAVGRNGPKERGDYSIKSSKANQSMLTSESICLAQIAADATYPSRGWKQMNLH